MGRGKAVRARPRLCESWNIRNTATGQENTLEIRGSSNLSPARSGPVANARLRGLPPSSDTMALVSDPCQTDSRSSPAGDARGMVDAILEDATRRGASDIHVEPTAGGYEIRYRVDGL